MMRSGLLHRGRCFTQTNTGPMEKDHPGWKHLNASLRDKVEILAENPYRFYIYPNVWTFRGPTRLEVLAEFLAEAEAAEDFELCARILEVKKALTSQLLAS